MRDIERCRTAALGGHLQVCEHCGHEAPAYNSCRNRHCPKCQCIAQARWIARRCERVLPCPHFHVVFTVPAELRALALRNRKLLYAAMFRCAADAMLEMAADPRRLGAQLGVTAVLHTWTRDLRLHPHLHCVVTAGGLAPDARWRRSRYGSKFLLPVRPLARLFAGKLIDALCRARKRGELRLDGPCAELADPDVFALFKDRLYRHKWVVYAKRPFAGAEHVFKYLGRYTHRVAISNQRLLSLDERGVRFLTKNGQETTLPVEQFISRFLLHVLPKGFVKVRHYGLYAAGNVNTRLERAREQLLGAASTATDDPPEHHLPDDWKRCLLRIAGFDVTRCPRCGHGPLQRRALPTCYPPSHPRGPPSDRRAA